MKPNEMLVHVSYSGFLTVKERELAKALRPADRCDRELAYNEQMRGKTKRRRGGGTDRG